METDENGTPSGRNTDGTEHRRDGTPAGRNTDGTEHRRDGTSSQKRSEISRIRNYYPAMVKEIINFGYLPSEISADELMKKQGYAKAGRHAAVKTCTWLKNSMNGQGVCYKSSFYGVTSHRCLQMTPVLMCNQECIFCWRPTEVPVAPPDEWDSPAVIVEESLKAQRKLVTGFGGSPNAIRSNYLESLEPSNVAVSLSGEPTFYPYLPELIRLYQEKGMSVFVVTNGTNPDMIRKIRPTQLYMSLDAADQETYEKVCRPKNPALWENVNESLDVLKAKKEENVRTALRITVVRGYNTGNEEGFAALIRRAAPDFVEIKSYMHVGFSRLRLDRENMMSTDEIRAFAERIGNFCGYRIAGESDASRVVVLTPDGLIRKIGDDDRK